MAFSISFGAYFFLFSFAGAAITAKGSSELASKAKRNLLPSLYPFSALPTLASGSLKPLESSYGFLLLQAFMWRRIQLSCP
jgi:hypothetical protein